MHFWAYTEDLMGRVRGYGFCKEHGILNENSNGILLQKRPPESSATTQRNSRASLNYFTCKHCLQCCNLPHSGKIVIVIWKVAVRSQSRKKPMANKVGSEVLSYQHVQVMIFDPVHLPCTCWLCLQSGCAELQKASALPPSYSSCIVLCNKVFTET